MEDVTEHLTLFPYVWKIFGNQLVLLYGRLSFKTLFYGRFITFFFWPFSNSYSMEDLYVFFNRSCVNVWEIYIIMYNFNVHKQIPLFSLPLLSS